MFIRERIHTDTESNYFSLLPNLRGARITPKCHILRALIQYRIIFFQAPCFVLFHFAFESGNPFFLVENSLYLLMNFQVQHLNLNRLIKLSLIIQHHPIPISQENTSPAHASFSEEKQGDIFQNSFGVSFLIK